MDLTILLPLESFMFIHILSLGGRIHTKKMSMEMDATRSWSYFPWRAQVRN